MRACATQERRCRNQAVARGREGAGAGPDASCVMAALGIGLCATDGICQIGATCCVLAAVEADETRAAGCETGGQGDESLMRC